MTFHLFLSYARVDNQAKPGGEGWVTAFANELQRRHRAYTTRDLRIFFDVEAIDHGVDWKRRLGEGLRQSSLFLAFLSPNYLTGENCLWEWEEYLRREHGMARGDDGLTPVFFVTPDDLSPAAGQTLTNWLADMHAKCGMAIRSGPFAPDLDARVAAFAKDVRRRNCRVRVELQPWLAQGPEVLKQIDAAERSAALKARPRDPAAALALADALRALDKYIAQRLDRLLLADLAPGNVQRGHEHFVGRHRELSELHTILMTGGRASGGQGTGGRGMIAASHGPGGLGKTALARQYAHAYAEFYAAGGAWEIPCEGKTAIGQALLRLADDPRFRGLGDEVGVPFVLDEAARSDEDLAAVAVLAFLARVTAKRVGVLREALAAHPERRSQGEDLPIRKPRALLILDNVDRPELLAATQLALLPTQDWLEVLVTTRLDPGAFGGGGATFAAVAVDVLPVADALDLVRDFQPERRFASSDEENAARTIVEALGGWTLAVEIVAAFLGDVAKTRPRDAAQELWKLLQHEGLAWVDSLAAQPAFDAQQRHRDDRDEQERRRQNRVGTLVEWSLARLSAPARTALQFASLLMPDAIPTAWLAMLTSVRHPEIDERRIDNAVSWERVWAQLHGLRLLQAVGRVGEEGRGAGVPEVARVHRLVAEHVAKLDSELVAHGDEVEQFFVRLAREFEARVGQREDRELRATQPMLRDQLAFLITRPPAGSATSPSPSPRVLRSAGVVVSYEGDHGLLATAVRLQQGILQQQERLLAASPDSAQVARDVSVSLVRLGDFLARRGSVGDSDEALQHYMRSHGEDLRLLAASPDSAQAARDVSVSLERLGDFLVRRGLPGDHECAVQDYQDCLDIRERLLAASPDSAQAARDVSVVLSKLADCLASRALPGDCEMSLEHHQRCHEVLVGLRAASPDSAQAARDVATSHSRLGETLAKRGRPGDRALALDHYKCCHEMLQRLHADNPDSAQAAADFAMSLERLADLHAQYPTGIFFALRYQHLACSLTLPLHENDPHSWLKARAAAMAQYRSADFERAANRPHAAKEAFSRCHRILDTADRAGLNLDPPMRGLLQQLRDALGKQPPS